MPIAAYNHLFGGKRGAARETLAEMVKRYGEKKGRAVFYGLANKRKKKLSDHMKGRGT